MSTDEDEATGSSQPASDVAEAPQLRPGFALRQGTLAATWPNRSVGSPFPAGLVGVSDTRLRASVRQHWYDLRAEAAAELQAGFGTTAGLGFIGGGTVSPGKPFEAANLTWNQATPSAATAQGRVERLDLAGSLGPLDFDLGRQPISLGTSHFVGVLDVLAPFAPGALDASYKPGIDALRLRTGLGDLGEAELITAGTDPWNQGGELGRLRVSGGGFDVEFLGGRFRGRGFGGLGWEGQLGPAGLWGELAAFQRRLDQERLRGGNPQLAISGVTGVEFRLQADIQTGLGIMYQDFGARKPADLPSVYTDAPYREGWAFLGSAGYGLITISKQLHPLVNGTLAALVNAIDGSTLVQPRLTFSISDNADLGTYAWIGVGAGPRVEPTTASHGGALVPLSEFGMVPTGVGTYARWFF